MSALLRKLRIGVFTTMIGMLVMSMLAPAVALANQQEMTDNGQSAETQAAQTTEENGEESDAESEPSAESIPWKEPIAYGFATADVICRDAASTSANEIATLYAGQSIEITGEEEWVEGVSWTPVNCAGVGGFVATEYIATQPVVDEVEIPEVEVPEIPEVEIPEVEVPEIPEVPAVEDVVPDDTGADAPDAVDYLPWMNPIGTAYATADVTCRLAPSTSAPSNGGFAAGDAVPVTGEAIWAAGMSWTPVNCGDLGGYVATDYLTWEAPAAPEAEESSTTEEAAPEESQQTEQEEQQDGPETDAVEDTSTEEASTEEPTIPEDGTGDDAGSEGSLADQIIEETNSKVDESMPNVDEILDEVNETTDGALDGVPSADVVIEDTLPDSEPTEEVTEPTEESEQESASEESTDEQNGDSSGAANESTSDDEASFDDESTKNDETTDEDETEGFTEAPSEGSSALSELETLGTAEIVGGDIACRTAPDASASVITNLPQGMHVMVLSESEVGGWMAVVCNEQPGFVPVENIHTGGNTSDFDPSKASNAVVSNTGGAGLNCRSSASLSASVIGHFSAGSAVTLTGNVSGEWVQVVCGGGNGWVHGDYLSAASAPSNGNNSGNNSGGGSGTATVSGTNGDGLRCRSGAGTGSSVVTVMAEGTKVDVRGAAEGGWLPIVCAGQNGYAHTDYLTLGTSGGNTGGDESDSGNNDSGSSAVTGTATVVNTGGAGLRCRTAADASSSIITVLPANSTVSLRDGDQGDWLAVVCGGQNGFAHSDYLSTSAGTGNGGEDSDNDSGSNTEQEQPSGNTFSNGDHARTTANLNLRYDPQTGPNVATVAPSGTVVLITGGHAGNGYYPVDWDGLKGFMHGDYLSKTSAELSQRGGSAQPDDGNDAPPTTGGGSSTGNAIVDFAMGYLGYPYVWATAGPSSFDCSGFTYWVIKNVVGRDIGRGLWTQASAGPAVGRYDLIPGDLVMFQNTYTAGLSHVGIYIGNDQFIHAENETTGVRISDLNSNYYSSRWYGAVRVR